MHQHPCLVGGIEAGGTKILCAIANMKGDVVDQIRIETGTDPDAVVSQIISFFAPDARTRAGLSAIGIGSFGPIRLKRTDADFGSITATTKAGWLGFNWLSALAPLTNVAIAIDSDVNSAALAEHLFGAGKGTQNLCYVTVGTGIGVGAIVNGAVFSGTDHLEAGHIFVRRAPGDGAFAGACRFHGDCLEGLASGPAMHARWGISPEKLGPDHRAWAIEADYLAQLCVNLTYSLRPEKIILGGGVIASPRLLDRVVARFQELLGGYGAPAPSKDPQNYIVRADACEHPGLAGAIAQAHYLVAGSWPEHGYALAS